jgi:hypothetical protein
MSQPTTVTLSPQVVSQLEPIIAETRESVEVLVNTAVVEYLRTRHRRRLRAQLSYQYRQLSEMWHELADDVADERWLLAENEALSKFEQSPDN